MSEPLREGSAADPPACRNCGAAAPGHYCPACGQETALALPAAGAFLREAAGRYVALDGRLARTLFHLAFRPGFLTREYFAGRRRRYIRPARLFLVLAIALFAVLRLASEANPGGAFVFDDGDPASEASGDPAPTTSVGTAAKPPVAGVPKSPGGRAPIKATATGEGGEIGLADLGIPWKLRLDDEFRGTVIGPEGRVRDRLQHRLDRFNRMNRQERAEELLAAVLRYGPYALVALLPGFALLLQIAYAGRAGRYPARPRRYAEHLVFGAHNHAFVCLALIVAVASPWGVLSAAAWLWQVFYLFRSLKVVYGGRTSGVLVRGALVGLVYLVMFGVATGVLLVLALLVG
jgi:hypothetical protein